MKALKLALLGSSFLFSAATIASAADVYRKETGGLKDEPYAAYAPITWAGFYVGAHAGGKFGDDTNFNDIDAKIDSAFTGGIHAGYNWQTANWVYGIEADLDLVNDQDEFKEDVTDFLASIRGRLGYSFGNTLAYATGGVAFIGYSDEFLGSDADTETGYVVGAGLEHKLSNNFSIGVEGLYYNFSSDLSDEVTLDHDFWTVRARATYHFGGRGDESLK